MSDRTNDSVPPGEYVPTADGRVVMHGLSWEAFESFLAVRGDSGPRVTYLEGTLELMSPSKDHEKLKSRLARIVEAYLLYADVPFEGVGAWLLKHAPEEAGLEPDECYLIQDLASERPHLALEIVWTSGGIDKLEIYRRLGVGEVWFWRNGALSFYVLTDSSFERRSKSACVPSFDPQVAYELMELESLSEIHKALRRRFG